jgi:hypothetical protein
MPGVVIPLEGRRMLAADLARSQDLSADAKKLGEMIPLLPGRPDGSVRISGLDADLAAEIAAHLDGHWPAAALWFRGK